MDPSLSDHEQSDPARGAFLVFGRPVISEAAIGEVVDTLRSGWIGTGPKTAEFERRMGAYLETPVAKATSSCTAALHVALILAGIGPGDEVITTPVTFASTANVIVHTGATPVFADVERRTMNIDAERVEAAVTPKTRAIVPVHLAGRPCDLDALHDIARRHGLVVIEDAAHALGAEYRKRPIGGQSDFSAFSFYPTKNITTGEGGLLTARDPSQAGQIDALIMHGLSANAWSRYTDKGPGRYEVVVPGYKYNMTDIQASLGLHQVDLIEPWREARTRVWERYDEALEGLPVWLPAQPESHTVHARHLYTLLLDLETIGRSREWFRAEMHAERIGTGVHFVAVHEQAYYRERFGYGPDDYPEASWVSERTVSLPLSPHLGDDDVEDVIVAVRRVLVRA